MFANAALFARAGNFLNAFVAMVVVFFFFQR
jgi:hypothetical protein